MGRTLYYAFTVSVVALFGLSIGLRAETDKPDPLKNFSNQSFLEAAYNQCATVENRSAKSCECERKLIGDRVNTDDKQMAYLYWTNKKAFTERFDARRKADPTWQKGFGERFSNLQAVVIAACGA